MGGAVYQEDNETGVQEEEPKPLPEQESISRKELQQRAGQDEYYIPNGPYEGKRRYEGTCITGGPGDIDSDPEAVDCTTVWTQRQIYRSIGVYSTGCLLLLAMGLVYGFVIHPKYVA